MEANSKTKIYFNIRKTTLEMIQDRGFKVSDEDLMMTYQDFSNRLEENQINIIALHQSSNSKGIYVHHILETKTFSKKDLLNLKLFMDENYPTKEMTVIIITQDKPTPQIAKELLNDEFKLYEVFLTKMLMFNITHHELVPKHVVLTEEEAKKVIDDFDATKSQLPKLLPTDPVAKYYGMKTGTICKIVRNSQMTGESIYYRIVK
jgi:DNA-directed RNA polymerase I, II, and III subunit RPABC1